MPGEAAGWRAGAAAYDWARAMREAGLASLTALVAQALVAAANGDEVTAAEALADAEDLTCSPARQAAEALTALKAQVR